MEFQGKSEHIIQNVVGCGPFQIFMALSFLMLGALGIANTSMFMAFGGYNKGWRCLDENTPIGTNYSGNTNITDKLGTLKTMSLRNETQGETKIPSATGHSYVTIDCPAYESCKNVDFNLAASTIITEWGLICNKTWITSVIISLQMFGFLIGCSIAGFVGDLCGRKKIIFLSQLFLVIFNVIASFSTSWQMFAVMRFFLGFSSAIYATLYYVYVAEFVTIKWRGLLAGFPSFPFCMTIFGLTCLVLKDWRHIHITTAVYSAIGLVPMFWMPESLRWLDVKNKVTEFEKEATKLAKRSNKTLPPLHEMQATEMKKEISDNTIAKGFRNTLHLFKKEYIKYTIVISVPWMSMSLIYYAIGFGMKSLSGDFYMNLILQYGVEIVFDSFLMFAPNIVGRKKSGVTFAGTSGVCLLVAATLDRLTSGLTRAIGVAAFVMVGRIAISALWGVVIVITVELYPTIIRGAATGWGNTIARIGGILAPVLIPNDKSMFFVCYIAMGVLGIISCLLILTLPETRGTKLQETFKENKDAQGLEEHETESSFL